jgi:hypothetical protein
MRYDIQTILLPPLQRRQLQDEYIVHRNHDTSLPRLSTWQGVRLPLQTHAAESSWRWWRSPRLVWHQKIHYLVGKRAQLEPILNQLKLARTILLKTIYVWVFQLSTSPLGFPTKIVHASLPWMTHSPPHSPTPIQSCFRSSSLCNCLHSSLSISKYSLHAVLQHLQFTFFQLHYRPSWPIFNHRT